MNDSPTRQVIDDLPANNNIWMADLDGWLEVQRLRNTAAPLPNDLGLMTKWIDALYVPTRRDTILADLIWEAFSRNGASQRHWLGIDGPAHMGKSELVTAFALSIAQIDGQTLPVGERGRLYLPTLYAEGSSAGRGLSLLEAFCNFGRLPVETSEDRTRNMLALECPRLHTRICIEDDAHMWDGTTLRASHLNDSLRTFLRLPVMWIFVGAGITHSALLRTGIGDGYQSTEQMSVRCDMLTLHPMTLPESREEYRELLAGYVSACRKAIPGIQFSGLRSNRCVKELLRACEGRHGSLYSALKRATKKALAGDRDVTADLLRQVTARTTVRVPGSSMSTTLHSDTLAPTRDRNATSQTAPTAGAST